MAVLPKYFLIDREGEKIIGSAQDIEGIVRHWHSTGESGTIVKVVTWRTEITDITDKPSEENQ